MSPIKRQQAVPSAAQKLPESSEELLELLLPRLTAAAALTP